MDTLIVIYKNRNEAEKAITQKARKGWRVVSISPISHERTIIKTDLGSGLVLYVAPINFVRPLLFFDRPGLEKLQVIFQKGLHREI